MIKFDLKKEGQPSRCEICHKIDKFDTALNHCLRCKNVSLNQLNTNNSVGKSRYIEMVILVNVIILWVINWSTQYFLGFVGSERGRTLEALMFGIKPLSFCFFISAILWHVIVNCVSTANINHRKIQRAIVTNFIILINMFTSIMFCFFDLRSTYYSFNNKTKPDEILVGIGIGILVGFIFVPIYWHLCCVNLITEKELGKTPCTST